MTGSEEKPAPRGASVCRTAADVSADGRVLLLRDGRAEQHLSYLEPMLPIHHHRQPWAELTTDE